MILGPHFTYDESDLKDPSIIISFMYEKKNKQKNPLELMSSLGIASVQCK